MDADLQHRAPSESPPLIVERRNAQRPARVENVLALRELIQRRRRFEDFAHSALGHSRSSHA